MARKKVKKISYTRISLTAQESKDLDVIRKSMNVKTKKDALKELIKARMFDEKMRSEGYDVSVSYKKWANKMC